MVSRPYDAGEAEVHDSRAASGPASSPPPPDEEAPILAWLDALFAQAVRRRAREIHLDLTGPEVVARYRIDGHLHEAARAPAPHLAPILARVKTLASIDLAPERLPRSGHATLEIDGARVHLDVATGPTSRGHERLVARLRREADALLGLADLGFSRRDEGRVERLLQRPDGVVLVAGPLGSGRTTTLYACLDRLAGARRTVVTVEDPVERELAGTDQIPVRRSLGLTFAAALRASRSAGPDVIMVGEILDLDTVEVALHAALSGHLVLSAIHAENTASALTCLLQMGVDPSLVRPGVAAVLAQRLVRLLCPHCKVPCQLSRDDLARLGLAAGPAVAQAPVVYEPGGCPRCAGVGFAGRTGVFELLVVDDAVRSLVAAGADAPSIERAALAQGMVSLRADGARKVLEGITTVEEVVAMTPDGLGP
jgi:general secretion pathway protein E